MATYSIIDENQEIIAVSNNYDEIRQAHRLIYEQTDYWYYIRRDYTPWEICQKRVKKFWSLLQDCTCPAYPYSDFGFEITSTGGQIGRFQWTNSPHGGESSWDAVPF